METRIVRLQLNKDKTPNKRARADYSPCQTKRAAPTGETNTLPAFHNFLAYSDLLTQCHHQNIQRFTLIHCVPYEHPGIQLFLPY